MKIKDCQVATLVPLVSNINSTLTKILVCHYIEYSTDKMMKIDNNWVTILYLQKYYSAHQDIKRGKNNSHGVGFNIKNRLHRI